MDFSFSTDQVELRELARRILEDADVHERRKAAVASPTGADTALWRALGDAGLIGLGLPETSGGGGLGWIETCVVLEEIGRTAAPIPALGVMALAAPALVGRPELADVLAGSVIITAAVHEPIGDPWRPSTTAVDGRVNGTKVCVDGGLGATAFVVTTTDGLHLVRVDAPGVVVERQDTTSGIPDALVTFENAPAEHIGDTVARDDLIRRGISAACLMVSGACASALRLTAEYTVARQQFDKPIASFQAVSQRAGDAYIDTEAVRLTAWQAALRLASGHGADEQLLSAKFWAADGGWRVVHAAHHLHGGMGVDRDYPLHRFFLLHKQLELQLGSATPSLRRLGRILADTPVA
jgi:3-oxocholest-4-en-26-oyl-CoA dehydrogenase beta subunit